MDDFYINDLMDNGFQVEYWDITHIYFKDVFSNLENVNNKVDTFEINSIEKLEIKIRTENNKNTLYIPIVTLEGRVYNLYNIFFKYNCKVGIFGRNMIPLKSGNEDDYFTRIKRITLKKIYNWIELYKLKKLFITPGNGYSVIFQGGEKGQLGIGLQCPQDIIPKIIHINSDDYDRAMLVNKSEISNYAVFLDEYLPFHPDLKICNLKSINPENYYNSLNAFFDKIETELKIEVIVAAHPKALKYKKDNYFAGRKVIYNKTAELVRNSQFVIAHDSTSVNYAIIYRKPLILTITNDIISDLPSTASNVKLFADYLNIVPININMLTNIAINDILIVDEKAYEKWELDYLTWPDTHNIQTRDIVLNYLLSENGL